MTSTTKLCDEKELKEVTNGQTDANAMSKTKAKTKPFCLLQAFRLFDSNNDGRISTEEFVKLIKKIGGIMTGGQAKALLTLVRIKSLLSLRISGSIEYFRLTRTTRGTLSLRSFSLSGRWSWGSWRFKSFDKRSFVMFLVLSIIQDDPEIRKEFDRFDLDKNGFITKSLLRN